MKKNLIILTLLALCVLSDACKEDKDLPMTFAGKPSEGNIESFLGESRFDIKRIFEGNRFPNVVVGVDGTVLAFWGQQMLPRVRRSEDGGNTWGHEIEIGDNPEHAGLGLGAAVVDETTGDIIVFMDGATVDGTRDWYIGHSWRSSDNGRTWSYNGLLEDIIRPNTPVMIGGQQSIPDRAITHGHDNGITLRHGDHKGRLLISARNFTRPEQPVSNSEMYNCAIYSDDGGKIWHTSAPFPAYGTGEASLEELSDGKIYYNSRRHWAPEGENARRRWIAWSYDGGETWEDLSVSNVLPDGAQHRDYGLMGGLVRLPVYNHDILLFSNIESPEGRTNGTVWASFDGGKTWPIKRLVDEGRFAYSSMTVGRPETPGEGMIYLLYEGQGGAKMARFNLTWLLEGEHTGDGKVPDFSIW